MKTRVEDVLLKQTLGGDVVAKNALADWYLDQKEEAKATAIRHGVIKRFGKDFDSTGGALTLNPEDIGTHDDGWTIQAVVHEDWYEWVNYFEATHPEHGVVWGDFEDVVFATSEECFNHFKKHHEPSQWDYGDI